MSPTVWVCPNAKCVHHKELKAGQSCPLCGELAVEYELIDVGKLLRQKWNFKKSVERQKRREKLAEEMKFCPKCGSSNVNALVFYRPSVWKCLNCGYEGPLIVEDSQLAEKLRERYESAKNK